jgi:curved DNA-binding protein CbpA
MNVGLSVYPFGFLLGVCFWRRLALVVGLCLVLAGGAGAIPVNPADFNKPAKATPAATAKPDAASDTKPAEDQNPDGEKNIAAIRNGLAKSCFGGPVIAFGFAVPFIFGEKLHETFAPYVSGILMIVFAIWAYLKVGSALLPFGPKDQAASLFNAIGVRFFVVLGVAVFLLAPTTGYTAYRDYIITPILSAGTTIVDKMYDIGIETNPTLAKFAKEDGACTPTPIKGLDAKLTAIKDNLECKVCMIQRAYSYPWSYGLFQVGNGKIFTGLLLMLVGIAPFLMFLFTVADVFMVRIGYVSCTLSAYAAAGCFPASRKYAITGLKSLSDGAMVLITSMIAAMISISMLTTVIENLDKGGQGDFAADVKPSPETPKATPLSAPLSPSGTVPFASNVQTPTTTYATGPMGASTPNGTYASWYRNTYLRQSPPPQNTGFDTFGERALSGGDLGGGIPIVNPFMDNKTPTSGMGYIQEFGLNSRKYGRHAGQDYDCPSNHPLRPMTNCRVVIHQNGSFTCRVVNGSQDTNVAFSYLHLVVLKPFPVNTIIGPSQSVGYCFDVNAGGTGANAHLHLEIEICDNLSSQESLARMQAKYPASLTPGTISFRPGQLSKGGGAGGRNCYLVHPNIFVKGAMAFSGTEAAGFSAVATNFKNFGILDVGFLLVVVMCIVSLQILKQAQRFTSGQGMGVFMKALGQMITGVIQTLGAMVGVGAKAAEMAAPLAGSAMGAAAAAAGQMMERTGFDKVVNRAAEGVQGAMNNVTQGLSGVMGNIGSGISGFVQQSVQAVQNLPITQRVMEFQQGMRDLAAGIASSDFAQGIARVVMPGVAVLTFATKNVALPVAGFAFDQVREGAKEVVRQSTAVALNTLTNGMFEDVNLAGELQNVRDALAKAPVGEAPVGDATPPAVEQQAGLVRVQNTADVTTAERQTELNYYELLGLGAGATRAEIKAAYRDLANQYHSDVNPNGTQETAERFKGITNAYNTLKDDDLRVDYDRTRTTSRDNGQETAPQEITPETTRALSGTTVAPIPRGQTEDSRAAEESSRRDSVAASREALGDYAGGGSYSGGYESRFREEDPEEADNEPTTNESSSNTKPKTEGPANNIVSARGLRDNNKKPDPRQEGMKRAASVAGDGVSANEILAETGIDATEAEMRAAKNNIVRLKRAATPTPTSPKSRR